MLSFTKDSGGIRELFQKLDKATDSGIEKIKDAVNFSNNDVEEVDLDKDLETNKQDVSKMVTAELKKAADKVENIAKGTITMVENPDADLTKLNVAKNSDGIFDHDNLEDGRFGGDQGSIVHNLEQYINKSEVRDIVSKYYSSYDSEDLHLLFEKMQNIGCGYVAAINTVFYEYLFRNSADFREKFDFSMYNMDYKAEGSGISFNYEALFLDFFLYYAKNVMGFDTIEEVYGNIEDQRQVEQGIKDGALTDSDFEKTGMGGANVYTVGSIMEDYLKEKGIELNTFQAKGVEVQPGTEKWQKLADSLKNNQGVIIPEDRPLYAPMDNEAIDYYIRNKGCQIVASAEDFNLYSPTDVDGNGILDDIVMTDVGPHAMEIVGTTGDPSKVVVSSWGKEYVMNIDDIYNFQVYDYS